MFDYTYLETLSAGEERLRYLKQCISAADNRSNYEQSLELRYAYIKESVFSDNFSAIIMFPQYMALFNEHPDIHDRLHFMTAFKWMIEACVDYFQVSANDIENFFEKFKEYCISFGYSLRAYYIMKARYSFISAPEKVNEYMTLWKESDTDELSDCKACEKNTELTSALLSGEEEKAEKILSDIISRNLSCGKVPHTSYGMLVRYFIQTGNLEQAEHYADLLLPMVKGNIEFLTEIAHVFLLKTFTAPNEAYNIFCKHLELFIRTKNPKLKFYFANAAAVFFRNAMDSNQEELPMKLPRTFELYEDENLYSTRRMFRYFINAAAIIAQKFDKRNSNTFFTDYLNRKYPSEPLCELSLPEHGTADRQPFSYAVPFLSEESVPSCETIISLVKKVPDLILYNINNAEPDTIVLYGYNEYIEAAFLCKLFIVDPEDLEDYYPVHPIPEETTEHILTNCKKCIVVSTFLNKGSENSIATLLLQFADAVNIVRSPIILCITNGTILSSEWVHFHTSARLPLFDKYMYGVHAYPSMSDETRFDVMTSGLVQQGSRELTVINVEEDDLDFINSVISQIADLICGFTELRDENCVTGFGVVYNEESEVQFSWIPVEKAYPDSFSKTDKELAVPILYLSADDAENGKGYLINEIPYDIRGKIDFRNSLKSLRIEAVLAQKNLPIAFEAMQKNENSELIIGVNIPIDDPEIDFDYDEICIRAMSFDEDKNTVTGKIVLGLDNIEGYQTDKTVTVDTESIIFWRFEFENKFFSADDTYLIAKLQTNQ
ncbi:MAG: hypothetical protein E7505_00660 [Ruminococcus sp.]|nr:hypothetical protein [Ruminococcus sp.]